MTFAQALASAAALGLERLDSQLLVLHVLGRPQTDRAWLLAHDADPLEPALQEAFRLLCERRAIGEPLAYIVGHKEFFGLRLAVDERVLVPRPDTETLVEWALDILPVQSAASVVDLGTGSGAIALAIKKHRPAAQVEAVDAGAGALAVAGANAQALGLGVTFRQASWLGASEARYDLIVSNPPYVAEGDPHLAALAHEPLSALAAGADGLRDIRTIVRQAPSHLVRGGWLLLEHGFDQAEAVRALLAAAGFGRVASRRDIQGIERCSGGQWLELG
ncbi:MAG: peptide chain release factor N(5)-glutamine methyltransferase [Ramlibacter sp.]|nr:peptide chain release factor N(5)-glutamine methyltransferase [Ramlibacter sp.]